MKVLVNAIRLSSAGGLRVGINLLGSFDKMTGSKHQIIFLCPKNHYSNLQVKNIEIKFLPDKLTGIINWGKAQRWLKNQIDIINPDVFFNLCNTPVKTEKKQLLLLHWAYAVTREPYIWKRMPFRDWVRRKIRLNLLKRYYKYVDHLTVQTPSMKFRAQSNFLGANEITIVPSSIEEHSLKREMNFKNQGSKKYLYLSKYYYHKNHNILIDVAELIRARKVDFVIQVTIDKNQPEAKKFLKKVDLLGLNHIIENLGEISFDEIDKAYENSFATLNPSLLESFGLTYLESAANNRLVLASNLDFVKETMHDAVIYFDPFVAESIYEAMLKSTNESIYLDKVAKGKQIVRNWPSWDEIAIKYLELIENMNE